MTFTDTYNSVTEVLGTVQVQSTNGNPGTAILRTEVGGVGTHQFSRHLWRYLNLRNQFVFAAIGELLRVPIRPQPR